MKKEIMTAAVIAALTMAGAATAQAQSQDGNFESNVQSGVNDNHEDLVGEQKDLTEAKDLNDPDLINSQQEVIEGDQGILNDEKDFITENRDLLDGPEGLTDKDMINNQKGEKAGSKD